jgi:hypothetical protein
MFTLEKGFITPDFLTQLDKYVESNIVACCKTEYKDFLPLISSRIEKICNAWFEEVKKKAKEGQFSATLTHESTLLKKHAHLDNAAAKLIVDLFVSRLGIRTEKDQHFTSQYKNFLCPNILPNGGAYSAICYWTPRNPYLYEATEQQKLYQYDPAADGALFLSQAQQGKETDVIIKSKEGDSIPAHSLFLKTKSEYFKTALEAGLKEASSKEIQFPHYSTEHLNSAIEFIYTGQINTSSQQSLSDLEEILGIAHLWQLKNLSDYCIDLINERLKQGSLTSTEISQTIQRAYLYELKGFLIPCLQNAERLEDSENAVDWNQIKSEHYPDLLEIASKHSLEKVSNTLKQVIEQLLKQLSIDEEEEKDTSFDSSFRE